MEKTSNNKEFMIEGAQVIYRNFSGKEGQYNREGLRQFAILLTPDTAEQLSADGWNVKIRESKHEDEEPFPYIPVFVRFDPRPPRITMIANEGRSRTLLDEDAVGVLDSVDIANADILCNGYEWEFNGKSGIKAYLKTMFVTLNEDALERKYASMEIN